MRVLASIAFLIAGCVLGGCQTSKQPTTDVTNQSERSVNVGQLHGSRWIAVKVDGKGVLPTTELTLDFMPDHIAGFGGCNGFGGQYDPAHPVAFKDVIITVAGCMREGISEQEDAYYHAVVATRSAVSTREQLVLRDATGRTRVELKRRPRPPVASQPLSGTRWQLETMNGAPVPKRVYVVLEFVDARTFRGVQGCQSETGTYEVAGERLRFPSTSMEYHCGDEASDRDWRYMYPGDVQQFWNDGHRLHLIGRNHHRAVMRSCPECSMTPRPR